MLPHPRPLLLAGLVALGLALGTGTAAAAPVTFTQSGTYVTPPGVTTLYALLSGANGTGATDTVSNEKGLGRTLYVRIPTGPGLTFFVNPNRGGGRPSQISDGRGVGGGAADIATNTTLNSRVVVAGGGGAAGVGTKFTSLCGGNASAPGQAAEGGCTGRYNNGGQSTASGRGATQTSGGAASAGGSGGSLLTGGNGGSVRVPQNNVVNDGGGGGGGLYGGGGGGATFDDAGGGGGGTSYVDTALVTLIGQVRNSTTTPGQGTVVISPDPIVAPTATLTPASSVDPVNPRDGAPVGKPTTPVAVTIRNTSTLAPLRVRGVRFVARDADRPVGDFSTDGACDGVTLPVGGSCVFRLVATPSVNFGVLAKMVLDSDAGSAPSLPVSVRSFVDGTFLVTPASATLDPGVPQTVTATLVQRSDGTTPIAGLDIVAVKRVGGVQTILGFRTDDRGMASLVDAATAPGRTTYEWCVAERASTCGSVPANRSTIDRTAPPAAGLALTPPAQRIDPTRAVPLTATVTEDASGDPVADARVQVTATGANPSAARVLTTGADGRAPFTLFAAAPGDTTVTACFDADRDGAFCEDGEPVRTATITTVPADFTLTPPDQAATVGDAVSVVARLRQAVSGTSVGNIRVHFDVTGANPQSADVELGNSPAVGTLTYTGTRPGTDTIVACVDGTRNGRCDPDDTFVATATATFASLPATAVTATAGRASVTASVPCELAQANARRAPFTLTYTDATGVRRTFTAATDGTAYVLSRCSGTAQGAKQIGTVRGTVDGGSTSYEVSFTAIDGGEGGGDRLGVQLKVTGSSTLLLNQAVAPVTQGDVTAVG